MKAITSTPFEGVYIIEDFNASDNRGLFVKTFNTDFLCQKGIEFHIRETYYSVSKKGVIRGMHFQLPPYDHQKLVYVVAGSVIDVIVDLRGNSNTYSKCFDIVLKADDYKAVYIPKGFAHGFKSLEDDTVMMYNVSTVYNAGYDAGIRYDSFGFDWKEPFPILSQRDIEFPTLKEFSKINPFAI